MPYCSGCGFNNMEAVNFCTKCGIAMHSNAPQSQNPHQQSPANNLNFPVLGEEFNHLYYVIMGCLLLNPFLLIFYGEGTSSWGEIYKEDGWELLLFVVLCVALFIALFHYLIKTKGINQSKPGFIMAALLIMLVLTVSNIFVAEYALYNWANWVDEILSYVMIGALFILWKKMKDALS